MASSRFVALTVTPGTETKVILPPCSALELKNVAAANPHTQQKATLECDLATKTFRLANVTPRNKQQNLGVAITNDPNEIAWFYLNAKGDALHVVGTLIQVQQQDKKTQNQEQRKLHHRKMTAMDKPSKKSKSQPVQSSNQISAPKPTKIRLDDAVDVLLPHNDQQLFCPSDAESDDFVQWVRARNHDKKESSDELGRVTKKKKL